MEQRKLEEIVGHMAAKTGIAAGYIGVINIGGAPTASATGPATKPIELPYTSIGSLFKGRDSFLARLHDSLQNKRNSRTTAIAGRAVHGLGGVGKTRLAVEYAWRYADKYSAVLFVVADSQANLNRNLAALTERDKLNLPEQTVTEEPAKVAGVIRWLKDHPGWLLILDNVDTADAATAVKAVIQGVAGGHTLVTGRLSRCDPGVEALELDVLEQEHATRFLMERTRERRRCQDSDEQDARVLAGELDGLALALEQAGAYINQKRISIGEYLEVWRAHEEEVQDWFDERIMNYRCGVAVTWQTTIDQLGAAEVAMLRLLCWLAPDPVPEFVFEGEKIKEIWQVACALAANDSAKTDSDLSENHDTSEYHDALGRLADFSMVRWDATEQTITVHRVVQEILRSRIPDDRRVEWITLALLVLDACDLGNPQDVRTWDRWNPLQTHLAVAVGYGDAARLADPTSRLMNNLGQLLKAKALFQEAEPLMRRALHIAEQAYGPTHPTVAVTLNNLASLLQATNRLAEAEPLMRRALDIDKQAYGPNHPTVAIRLNNLAQLLQATNRLDEAEPPMRRALNIDEQAYGPNHPDVAVDLNNLSRLLQDTNRLDEAEPLMLRVVRIFHEFGNETGHQHPHMQLALTNYFHLLKQMKLNDEEIAKRMSEFTDGQ